MNANKCLKLLREIKDVALATVDKNGNPQVRIIDVMIVENETLYFVTARGKNFHSQLLESKKVAIAGLTKNYESIRLMGKVSLVKEQSKWLDRVFEENTVMNDVYPKDSRYILDVFYINEGEIEYFNLSKSPIYRKTFSLKSKNIFKKGFYITNDCIKCDKCRKNCPQQCITKDEQYLINPNNCLHCGLCFEKCPTKAIIKAGE
ncbi:MULTISPECIES: pyridoxamine 5'-phosphate oxidase family protein [unclassified Romboutsia]|uniref:pyridoxamine 5'-phosphate oxidase family protein n=1 Tax=unclassified Romboutsia TaxID=2626894 RepID=UPI000F05ED57|nr:MULTISPECIES: pyridoxamine 5'-phosphate oxidase family protein [unclassified Romboutsia]